MRARASLPAAGGGRDDRAFRSHVRDERDEWAEARVAGGGARAVDAEGGLGVGYLGGGAEGGGYEGEVRRGRSRCECGILHRAWAGGVSDQVGALEV